MPSDYRHGGIKITFPPPEYGLRENFSVWLMMFCGRERIRTEKNKDTLRNKSHCTSREVIMKRDLFRRKMCKFNHIDFNIQ